MTAAIIYSMFEFYSYCFSIANLQLFVDTNTHSQCKQFLVNHAYDVKNISDFAIIIAVHACVYQLHSSFRMTRYPLQATSIKQSSVCVTARLQFS